ncbi:glycoside hydrolase family 47 protein [Backusella circina FSU 941]|nr:glycoside hydrolase family 47 protein [Backusella circina FSU 941]
MLLQLGSIFFLLHSIHAIQVPNRINWRKERGGLPDTWSNAQKQQHIKSSFQFAWEGYKNYSWGYDENRPVTNAWQNTRNGWGASIVDGLDTLYIMDLMDEFDEARQFVKEIDWDQANEEVQVFETVIRYVGGLLAAYDLSGDEMFVAKSVELVDRLMPAFDTPTGIPFQYMNFSTGEPVYNHVACLAEVGTLQIEFTRLSEITGNWTYHYRGQHVYDSFNNMQIKSFGLLPHLIDVRTGDPIGNYITWGGMADSFYEYLIKQLVTSKGQDLVKRDMVSQVIAGLESELLDPSPIDDTAAFLANRVGGRKIRNMDELACFAPGSLLLAARNFPELMNVEETAKKLMKGCYSAWDSTNTGLAPEIFGWIGPDEVDEPKEPEKGAVAKAFIYFQDREGTMLNRKYNEDKMKKKKQQRPLYPVHPTYILRPETVESLYYFYVYTHDKIYQDMAWDIYNSLYTYCKANSGFSGLRHVDNIDKLWDDRQESFFFAETLKYLYLIFDNPNNPRFPLDKWVFNTEAHPLLITDIIPPAEKVK